MALKAYDVESVQLKLDGETALLYCPLQYYQVDEQEPRECTESVMVLSAKSNLTVLRSPHRQELETSIMRYTYTSSQANVNTTMRLPPQVTLVTPTYANETRLRDLQKKLDHALNESLSHQKHEYQYTELIRRKPIRVWKTY